MNIHMCILCGGIWVLQDNTFQYKTRVQFISDKTLGQTFVPQTKIGGVPFAIFCDEDNKGNEKKFVILWFLVFVLFFLIFIKQNNCQL